jgi:hypothetical protein
VGQLLSHFEGNDSTQGPAGKIIGALGLYTAKRLEVAGSHILDAVQWVLIRLKAERLQAEYRLLGT